MGKFATANSTIHFNDGSHADIKIPTQTYNAPDGSQWRTNPIPGCACDLGEGCGGKDAVGSSPGHHADSLSRTDSAQEFLAPGNCIRIMEVRLPLVLVVPCSKLVLTNSRKVFLRVPLTNSALWMRSKSRANLVSTSWAGGGIVKKQTRFGTPARIS